MKLSNPLPPREIRVGEIVGCRFWRVRNDTPCLLHSSSMDNRWDKGITKALCDNWGRTLILGFSPPFAHESPLASCCCGIYSYKPGAIPTLAVAAVRNLNFRRDMAAGGIALGTVLHWGETIEHDLGYRSEFAEVNSIDLMIDAVPHTNTLHIDDDRLRLLQRYYEKGENNDEPDWQTLKAYYRNSYAERRGGSEPYSPRTREASRDPYSSLTRAITSKGS